MNPLFRSSVVMIAVSVLALSGCGRKAAPQPLEHTDPPAISSIQHEVSGNSLQIILTLSGGSQGIGYQIDRAEIDPACNCAGFWRRYREEPPVATNLHKSRFSELIILKDPAMEYAFRVRAIDAPGRLGPWSKTIRVRADAKAFP